MLVLWWGACLGATVPLVGWQVRLARARTPAWGAPAAYALALLTSVGVTGLAILLGSAIAQLFPPARLGRTLGILVFVAWGWQCWDRWLELRARRGGP